MKHFKFLLLTAAALLAACTSSDEFNTQEQTQNTEEEMPVGFDTYLSSNSQGATRNAYTGGLFTATQLSDPENGFGIFAYLHGGGNTYKGKPNFMYDQKVVYSTSTEHWEYSPLKYWPNMTPNASHYVDRATGNTATATGDCNMISFFAYAPYIPYTGDTKQNGLASDGTVYGSPENTAKEYGITKFEFPEPESGHAAPLITYKVNPDATKAEDLLWGTAPTGGIFYKAVNGQLVSESAGLPMKNMIKPDAHTYVKFLFQHALTAMTMDIQLAVDQVSARQTGAATEKDFGDGNTKVFIESIVLGPQGSSPAFGFATEGMLSLENTTPNRPLWTKDANGTALDKGTLSILKTEEEGAFITLPTSLTEGDDNSGVLAQSTTYVFGDAAGNAPLMVIPVFTSAANQKLTVTVTYKVVTKASETEGDKNNSSITNSISKDVILKGFRSGRFYKLHLVLGLTSLQVDADALDWAVEEQDVDLPRNMD